MSLDNLVVYNIINEYLVKTWTKFNKNRKVCSQGIMFPSKISLILLPCHVLKSEQT